MARARASLHGVPIPSPFRPGTQVTDQNTILLDDLGYKPRIQYETNVQDQPPRAVGWREVAYNQVPHMIGLALKWYQSLQASCGSDPFVVHFPYAWNLLYSDNLSDYIGRKVLNHTKSVVYSIKGVRQSERGIVLLEGTVPPELNDKLMFSETVHPNLLINFVEGYPHNDENDSFFTQEDLQKNAEHPWTDTISYRLLRSEPAGVKEFFSGTRDRSYRQIETIKDENGTHVRTTQRVDTEFQFDCWTQSNDRSTLLAEWFKSSMKRIIPALQANGLMVGTWTGQLSDRHVTRWRNDILGKSQQYMFRTSEIEMFSEEEIKSLTASVAVSNEEGAEIMSNLGS